MTKRLIAAVIALMLAGILVGIPHSGSAQSGAAWLTFGGNTQRDGSTTAAGPSTNATTNQWQLPQKVESSPVVDANGIAYVGDDDGNVYALNPFMAQPLWAFKTGGAVVSSPTLSADGTTLYVGSNDSNVYALNTTTGKSLWSVNVGAPVVASPLLTLDGKTVIVPTVDGSVYGLKTSDGSNAWGGHAINLGTSVPGSLSLSPDGSTFYVATNNAYVYGIQAFGNGAGKNVVATFYLDSAATSTPSVDGNGQLYVTTARGNLESFAPDGTYRWTYSLAGGAKSAATPAIANGLVLFGASNGTLYDLSPSTGQPVWSSFPHVGGNIGSSAAVSANGLIYVGSDDGNVYAIKASDGTIVWQKSMGGPVSASPALAADGSLWVASQSGIVDRISANQANPTPTATGTATITSTPRPTATPTPPIVPPPPPPPGVGTPTATATLLPTATPTTVPLSFSLTRIRIQSSGKASWSSHNQGLKQVRLRQKVTLAAYVQISQLPLPVRLQVNWKVTKNGKRVAHHGKHYDLAAGSTGRHYAHWAHAFTSTGTYKYSASAIIAGTTHTKTVTFKVVR